MSNIGEVHWHEGLFLQPQHLQTMQRHLSDLNLQERRLRWAYPSGLVESSLSADALENLMVKFDRLRAVTPGGVYVNAPGNAEIPALNIKEAFESGRQAFTIYLGVPLWYGERANVVDENRGEDWRVKRMFRVKEVARADENDGENLQPVLIRNLNARLLIEGEDMTDLDVLPVLRIAHATGEDVGLPRQEPGWIPPCLFLRGSAVLRELVRDLVNQIEASRKELVLQIRRGGFNVENMRGIQFEQMLRLKILNRFSARLPEMIQAPNATPFEVYLQLRELLGELAALYPDGDHFETAPYNHDKPALTYQEISRKIRGLLRGAVAASYALAPFVPDTGMMLCKLTDAHFGSANEYYLGIRTKEDPRVLATLVEDADKFKLMAKSLIQRSIFGVKLQLERLPPLELPSEAGLTYFRLLRGESQRMWERVQEEKELAARWPGLETSDFKMGIYMTMPQGKG
jgi:type VI secretion system ImpJ/VasE family protein